MPTVIRCADNRLLASILTWFCLLLTPVWAAASTPHYQYLLHCAGCHLEDGGGMEGVVPDLREHLGWFASTDEGRSYLIRVPGSSQSPLDDEALATLLNWMMDRFSPDSSPVPFTEEEVSEQRGERMYDPAATRVTLLEKKESEQVGSGGGSLNPDQRRAFGRLLFEDEALSRNHNLACASCHDPDRAFSDPRPESIAAGASQGTVAGSFGTRNAPSLTYIGMTPAFAVDVPTGRDPAATQADAIRGGFFWDGRIPTLEDQVLRPFLNEQEMGLRDRRELAARVQDDPRYEAYLRDADSNAVLKRVAASLAAFLRSVALSPFNSRYDRFLRGEVKPTREEEVGMGLFFSAPFTSCADCHQSEDDPYSPRELFTNYRYANIGVPVNEALLNRSGLDGAHRDAGLGENSVARSTWEDAGMDAAMLDGRFKVSSLRNVAVTGPYMHNGVFEDLTTVLSFYNHYNESGRSRQINPVTGDDWPPAAHPDGVDTGRLSSGFPLSPRQLSALEAFLRMLTDQRYEHLLE